MLTAKAAPPARSRWEKIWIGILIGAIAAGVILRVVNLGAKPYWMDECYTLLRGSGYTAQEARNAIMGGEVVTASDIRRFQQPSPERGVRGTIEGLAAEEPQHPPLYFVLTRLWAETFGSSKAAVRSLPALFGILGIPAVFWLGWELFSDRAVAGLAAAFYSLSPCMVQFSQSARQYSLWLTLIVAASALFLRFLRQPKPIFSGLYGGLMAIALYTHLLTGFVLAAHGIYIAFHERFRLTRALGRWLLASAFALGVAFPWLILVWNNREIARNTTDWLRQPTTWAELLRAWDLSLGKAFIALHFSYYLIALYAGIPIAILTIYGFYFCFRHTPPRIWGMLSALAGTAFLPFLAADILNGGRRTMSDRYFLICYVCIFLAVSFLLVVKMRAEGSSGRLWRGVSASLLALSLLSSATGALATHWWGWSEFDPEIPPIVQRVDRPLVVAQILFYDSFRFAHEYDSDVSFLLFEEPENFRLPQGYENLFFFNPKPAFRNELTAMGLVLKPVYTFSDPSTDFNLTIYQSKLAPKARAIAR